MRIPQVSYRALKHITVACRSHASGNLGGLRSPRRNAIDSQGIRNRDSRGIGDPYEVDIEGSWGTHYDRSGSGVNAKSEE